MIDADVLRWFTEYTATYSERHGIVLAEKVWSPDIETCYFFFNEMNSFLMRIKQFLNRVNMHFIA